MTNNILIIFIATFLMFFTFINSSAEDEKHLMEYYKNGQATELPSMNITGINAYLKDMIFTNDPDSPVVCGLFRMEKGAPLEYTYTYDDVKIILEGEMTVSEEGGETVEAKPGDIFLYREGAKVTFSSNSSGLGFYCGQRAADEF
ncbi:MAG: DUF861 domain-containing protein [Gammaproteobacteria bacterium]|nr:DUF861 domain-containing protein [Gammaproteobacteria bacterium]